VFKDFVSEIVEQKKKDLKERNTFFSYWQVRLQSQTPHLNRFFKEKISKPERLNLIAEIKRASPSCGIIREDFDPVKIAEIYQESGADAISVLTEEHYFKGNLSHLNKVRIKTSLPLLRKDFIIEEFQIYESYVYGADAILLIADILPEKQLADFLALSHKLGMDCLVEVRKAEDVMKAVAVDAKIIGINNRDLHTFHTDLEVTAKLRPLIPTDKIVVSESGIKSHDDIAFLREQGVNAVLIGEAFLEVKDISTKVKAMLQQ